MDFDPETSLSVSKYRRTAPCPRCTLHIHWGELNCPHCHHKLSDEEIQQLKKYMKLQFGKGLKLSLIVMPIIFLVFLWIANR